MSMLRATAGALVVAACLSLLAERPLSGQIPAFGGEQEYLRDLAARRERVLSRMDPNTVLVLRSAPTRVYSTDTDYEYRQESNLLYLTGIDQPDTTLVLVST